jgi:hypothetical protein
VKKTLVAMMVAGAAWMAGATDAQAQSLITPTGPLAIRIRTTEVAPATTKSDAKREKVYPGRTMGGGTRILRQSPPPSSLKRRKE